MKKTLSVFVVYLMTVSVSIYAQARNITDAPQWYNPDFEWKDKDAKWAEERFEIQMKETPKENIFPVKNRTVEFGLARTYAGFSNSFISTSQIFRKTAIIDLDETKNGFKLNLDASVSPVTFNYNRNDIWGFGISTKVDAAGISDISEKMLNLQQIVNDKSIIGGSIFAEAGLSGFFTINSFKVKFKPSLYYPVALIDPDISYTYTELNGNPKLLVDYKIDVWTAFPYGTFKDDINITANPGVDLYFGLEYPFAKATGLSDKIKFLDFGLGLDFYNVPLVPAKLNDYMTIAGRFGSEDAFDILAFDFSSFFDGMSASADYKTGEKIISRPFKMLARADWRPLGIELLTIYPSIGFSINPFYLQPFSIESGIKARINLLNSFLVSAGIGYEDHLWKNSIDLAFNLRAFELNVGVDMRSQSFLRSWTASGLGAFFGLKLGW
jgi:hypothetical protein